MKSVKIVGVPEHFNLPWHLCIDNGEFSQYGIDLQWTDVPEGTGKMCEMLRNDQTDVAVILTEGIIKDIAAGNQSVIVQTYVQTPLTWGIHVAYEAPYQTLNDLENKTVAISRFGSGSHLMAVVNAHNNNWNTQNLKFEVVNTIDNAVVALQNKTADYFMWERFMTKPLVDKKIFRKIADCPTPWPCFVIAVRKQFYEENQHVISQILDIINATTSEFKHIPSIDKTIAAKFDIQLNDVEQWLKSTRWSQKKLDQKNFDTVMQYLTNLNIISADLEYKNVIK